MDLGIKEIREYLVVWILLDGCVEYTPELELLKYTVYSSIYMLAVKN